MKKVKLIVIALICICGLGSLSVFAGEWKFSDTRVDLVYWHEDSIPAGFWSGVYNKLSYQKYTPCIGWSQTQSDCAPNAANQWTYVEHVSRNDDDYGHFHYLKNKDGGVDYKY